MFTIECDTNRNRMSANNLLFNDIRDKFGKDILETFQNRFPGEIVSSHLASIEEIIGNLFRLGAYGIL